MYRHWILFIAVFLFTSCSRVLFTSIDVLRPARITFPVEVNNILIVNNARPQPYDYGHNTQLFDENARKISINTDSLPIFTVATLAQDISEKGFFNTVVFDPISNNTGGMFFSPTTPNESTIEQLRSKHQVEGVISLNRLKVNSDQAELYHQESGQFISFIEARYEAQWSIHFPNNQQIIPLIHRDTVFWESEANSRRRALSGLPDRRNALIDGAIMTGQNAVNHFIPFWEKSDRFIFTSSNRDMRAGIDSVYQRNWSAAATHWKKILDKKPNAFLKAKAAHNIAVALEITGDLKGALQYSNLANENLTLLEQFDYRSFVHITRYNPIIRKRVDEYAIVQKQLGEI